MPYNTKEKLKESKRKYYLKNKEQQLEKSRLWRLNNPEKVLLQQQRARENYSNPEEKARRRNIHLIKTYGISLDEYNSILEQQGGVCAICKSGQKDTRNGLEIDFNVDHDHVTGAVRGILCYKCNVSLGGFNDSIEIIENAIVYMRFGRSYLREKAGLDNE